MLYVFKQCFQGFYGVFGSGLVYVSSYG